MRSPFVVPEELAATEPPEARGLARDGVRLLVAGSDGIDHARFRDLPRWLRPGDLVVVNVSATRSAAVDGVRHGDPVVVHLSTALDDGSWAVELRTADGSGPLFDGTSGETVDLVGGGRLEILSAYSGIEGRARMLRARAHVEGSLEAHMERVGRPISYSYVPERWPLASYQTVFARVPGSAEMPSAGRPFSHELVTRTVTSGVVVTPLVLHAGVSSLDAGEAPLPERFAVPASTARLVNHKRANGGRVVAVGTTVTRALETAARRGKVGAAEGWTDLVLGPDRPAQVVDGLITGWHAPEASHQQLLEAVAGGALVESAYREALEHGYLWHEFGDACLFLP
jgi:S-adenosylmethionine:tRNA ribosyltransferase-isomerase